MMNRMGVGSMDGTARWMFKIEVPSLDVKEPESGGTYSFPERNDRIFVRRSRDDAEGDRRIIGSGRRFEVLGL